MKTITKLIPVIFLSVIMGGSLFYSCSQEKKEEIAVVLPLDAALSQAGENRVELEKALHRYQSNPSDSLKYRAACFLIENMPFYTYYKGKLLEQYLTFFTLLQEARSKKIYPQAMVDSVRRMYGPFSLDSLQYCKDVLTVDSAYLCSNIDWAFKVWQDQPWGKNVSFADFCEYILPYRIGDETLSYWREDIYRKYNPLLDSLRASTVLDIEDPLVAARCLCDSLRKRSRFFTTTIPQGLPHVGPEIAQSVSGSCRELSDYVVYVCRALGIPCAIDFMPLHGGGNDGHQWVSFADKYGTLYFQEYPDKIKEVRKDKMCEASKIKVYRNTFSLNRVMQAEMQRLDTAVVPFFRDPHIVDVTADYAKTYKKRLEIPTSMLYSGKPRSRIAYLCGSSRMDWEPVAWAEFDGKHLAFSDVQIEPVMRIATYERGRLRFWTDPFEMTVSGEFHVFAPSDSVQDVTLFAKYPLWQDEKYQKRMIGGVFEGSNDPDFRQTEVLFLIEKQPERLRTMAYSRSLTPFRYVRYIGPEKGHCNVAEIEFYEAGGLLPLSGRVIGTPGCYQQDGSHEYTNAFDGNTETSFDYTEPYGGWTGLDLGTPKVIDKIIYTPANRDNYVRSLDEYELSYCTRRGWRTLGQQTAMLDSLVYKRVPKGALLLLQNHTRGKQERIFVYEEGKQVWK
ncbi:discoidin domain-containing protein [Bacteroides caecimuris]|jgi:hypothetical protein|uniref:Peptide-N(4)-(N-acetyl-beta-glucosaminyl)asparagine amidase n=1 Tax=Bacteroides caecimuris TaxID=1796613 RepID=A0A1C7H4I9_9BACE|nr:discoidin domain-containing protein [Bacteroides caecimuris]ANU59553.1 hypothetical protein A4V03_19885 [Bacteroides caecimuris]OXE63577.1 hypothetical protein ADH74_11635 [Bacteroides caecimuris]QQR19051.1 discoidin domain-containing protein [Bacteroides caecimuris]UQA32085.1 discoidin domain-containing protein [Bacteroides caecimuris]